MADRYDKKDPQFVSALEEIKSRYNSQYCLQYKDEVCAVLVKYGRGDDEVIGKHLRDLTKENYRLMSTHSDGIANVWHYFQKAEFIR